MVEKAADDRGVSDQQDDVFSENFDKAAIEDKTDVIEEAQAGDKAPVLSPEEPPEPKVEAKVDAPPAPPVTDQQPGESDEKYEQRYKTLQGIHRKDQETWKAERESLLAQMEVLKNPPPADKSTDKAPDDKKEKKELTLADLYDSFSEQEKIELKGYDEEFDVISKMEGKKRDVAMAKLLKEIDAFKAEVLSQLGPVTAFTRESQQEREKLDEAYHFETLREVHPDYEQYRDDGSILKWIESKPKYLQESMLRTYSKGIVNEVVELLNDFKAETNINAEPPIAPIPDNKKAEKKLAMTAVTTRRGAVNPKMAVAEDFEGAYDEAIHKQQGG